MLIQMKTKPAGNFDQLQKLDLNTCGNLKSLVNKSIFPVWPEPGRGKEVGKGAI
jgi:hypothetical protein